MLLIIIIIDFPCAMIADDLQRTIIWVGRQGWTIHDWRRKV